uniref:Uncharacterized protein n=1 Tax=Anguilla anguilla TaxID=7936 RepID=A0A0E9SZG8_ANGAN
MSEKCHFSSVHLRQATNHVATKFVFLVRIRR